MPTIAEAHELARQAHQAGDTAVARGIYEQILKAVPEEAYALSGLASLAFEAGRLSQAKNLAERAIATFGDDPAFHNQLSLICRAQGRSDLALESLRNAVKIAPNTPELLNNLGVVLKECERYDEAASSFARALELKGDYVDAQFNLANTLAAIGRDLEAAAAYRRAIELAPDLPEQHCMLAVVLDRLGDWELSLASLRRALELKPDYADAFHQLDRVLEKLGRNEEARDAYLRAIELAPHVPMLKEDQIITHDNRPAIEQAVVRLERALATNSNSGNGYFVLARTLRRLDRAAEAELAYRRAIELAPQDGRALTELAVMLKDQGQLDEATRLFEHAVRVLPDSAAAHQNRALLKLLCGEFTEGFAEFEWRFRLPERTKVPSVPRWTGDALGGGTLLLVAEQGIGDTLQFLRYAQLVKARSGARVVLHCDGALHELMASVPGVDALSSGPAAEQPCDCFAPLMSLPAIFGTTIDTIPAEVPYLFAEPEKIERWRGMLEAHGSRPKAQVGQDSTRSSFSDLEPLASGLEPLSSGLQPPASGLLRVGIAWQGNPAYQSDARRSIPLAHFSALLRCRRVQLFSLQKGFGREQLAEVDDELRERIVDLGGELDKNGSTFVDTAAVIANLDLVITSDTAIAHLAGALGARAWVALALVPDWRWLLAGDTSPWYPTLRLFRQTSYGDWPDAFERMAIELERLSDATR